MKRADTPEQLHELFAEAFNARDLDALVALYADDACIWPRIDEPARCGSQLQELLRTYCAMTSTMQIATRKVMSVGDTALLMSDWRVTGIAPDGSLVAASGTSVEVARRGSVALPH